MEKLKVGIAGIGNMGSSHARKIFEGKIPDMELCAVADKKEERRSWAKECFGNISVYCDALDMLKHADIDAAIIAKHIDGAIIVVESGAISYKLAQNVKSQLEKSECRILGVVLNKMDLEKNGYYGSYYGKYYGKNYGNYGDYGN